MTEGKTVAERRAMIESQTPQIVLTNEQEKAVIAAGGAAVEWRSASGGRLGFARFVKQQQELSAGDITAAQARARRLGREYSPAEIVALRQTLQMPWSDEDLRRMKESRDPGAPKFSTAEVL